jgi:anti-sigma regulatory factor (Ser/Thr protein kinase)
MRGRAALPILAVSQTPIARSGSGILPQARRPHGRRVAAFLVVRSENTWPAAPEHVRDVRREIGELARRAGVPEDALDAVRLAVTEAVSNAVLHGYRGGGRGEITVLAEAEENRLEVRVRDHGCGMSPHIGGQGAGFGLPLIAELSDSVSVRPNAEGGTEIQMTFRLPADAAD